MTKMDENILKLQFDTGEGYLSFDQMHEAPLAVPVREVPVVAEFNGVKRRIGVGHIDLETLIFTTKLDDREDNPWAGIYYDYVQTLYGYGKAGVVKVSEMCMVTDCPVKEVDEARITGISLDKEVGPYGGKIETITVESNGHAYVDNEPHPKFHNHD